jgi:hypothetical protein
VSQPGADQSEVDGFDGKSASGPRAGVEQSELGSGMRTFVDYDSLHSRQALPTEPVRRMAHYSDFSEYCYGQGTFYVPGTVNIGWLAASPDFDQMDPDEKLLDLVWDYCKISVAQYRGIHECEYCHPRRSDVGQRHGEMRLLGSAEIRVFAATGAIYAAPDLIYHLTVYTAGMICMPRIPHWAIR